MKNELTCQLYGRKELFGKKLVNHWRLNWGKTKQAIVGSTLREILSNSFLTLGYVHKHFGGILFLQEKEKKGL